MPMSSASLQPLPLIGGRRAETVLIPETVDELCDILRAREGLTLVPVAGRTQLDLGNPPAGPFGLLELGHALSGKVRHEPADLTVEVPAATTLAGLRQVLDRAGQWLPFDPPRADEATVGGTLVVGAGGPLQSRHGLPRDFLLGMTVARPDGVLVKAGGRVVKNVTGYDLMRLHCGALGTLGVIVSVWLKVLPRAETADRVFRVESIDEGCAAAGALLRADLRPEIAEVLGDATGWQLFVRLPAAVATAAGPPLLPRVESSEDPAATYRAIRDLGFEAAPGLVVRAAGLPGDTPVTARALAALQPSAMAARPLVGVVRAAWKPGALPAVTELAASLDELRARLRGVGGSVIVDRVPPSMAGTVDTWGQPPESFALMQRTKAAYDPDNRLNHGRFVGGI